MRYKSMGSRCLSNLVVYDRWQGMLNRCFNPKAAGFKYYGARGITVRGRWLKFENFLADMGEPPRNTELDRINPNGDYEPGNCQWLDAAEHRAKTAREQPSRSGRYLSRWK